MTILRLIVIPLVIAVLLVACSPSGELSIAEVTLNTPESAQDIPTPTDKPVATATEPITQAPTETIAPTETATTASSPTPNPTATPEEISATSDTCLGCHMDKERLIETAAPEEKAPSESSGVG